MSIYTPYFYVIQDTRNGIYYAGAKWGKDADPKMFMIEGGYTTSSAIVNKIIDECGINVFVVKRVRCFESMEDAYNYETKFLRQVDARNNPLFYNQHNNDHLFTYHDDRYNQAMLRKYSELHPLHSDVIMERVVRTNIDRYNAPNVFSANSNMRCAIDNVFIEKYGVVNISQLPETQEKIRKTSIGKRGVDHHLKDPSVTQKRIDTITSRSNQDTKAIYDKVKSTKQQRYGDSKYNNREQAQRTNFERYGVENVSQIPTVQQKMSDGISRTKNTNEWKSTSGVVARERLSQTLNSLEWKEGKGREKSEKIREANKKREKKVCQHCYKAVSPTNYTRWHGPKCKHVQSLL